AERDVPFVSIKCAGHSFFTFARGPTFIYRGGDPTPAAVARRIRASQRLKAVTRRRPRAVALGRIQNGTSQRRTQGHRRYRIDRSAIRSAILSFGFFATRSSSRGPHTGRKSHHVHARSSGAAGRKPCSIARSMIVSAVRACARV